MLLEAGADVNARDHHGITPLLVSIFEGRSTGTLRVLLEAVADVNALQDGNGWTPLHHAADRGNVAAIRMLLKVGANPEVRTSGSSVHTQTPRDLARRNNHIEAMKALDGARR